MSFDDYNEDHDGEPLFGNDNNRNNSNKQQLEEQKSFSFDTKHKDIIHDAKLDYYGKTLATASSDCTVKLFEVSQNSYKEISTLKGHNGPVWKVSWCHPRYGKVLASCGYDCKVIIYNSIDGYNWNIVFKDDKFNTSVNCCAFSPVECGLFLAVGDSNGNIVVYFYNHNKKHWARMAKFLGHNGSINGISWSNQTVTTLNNKTYFLRRFATCGNDNKINIWIFDHKNKKWTKDCEALNFHKSWVRDVAFSPILSNESYSILASCSDDKTVIIHKEKNKKWTKSHVLKFKDKVWSVSWSQLGNVLGVSYGDNESQLYKEGIDGKWNQISKINNSNHLKS